MQFEKLRLAGFKSFVEPVEMPIEAGLTGVVGPNGCGKSNILEALRWVMGANSAKAMRAEGMDEVIFNGSGARPARSHAEVVLTIDNARGLAPAPFSDQPVLQVSRRIDRGTGSTYRINGKEVRAKDVQLLFADASTGANSPALVRQGQISELIAAKPQNRRRILEEAAGVAGLHGRRHEAELRLKAAEVNLERLGDVTQELESVLFRLKRESRAAEKYKRLSADIRSLQSAVHYARWAEARAALERVRATAGEAEAVVEATARAAATASTAAIEAEQKLRPLRDEAAAASAIFGRLEIEKDRIEREEQAAAAEVQRLGGDLARIAADIAHAQEMEAEAAHAGGGLQTELTELRAEIAAAPELAPQLEAAAKAAEGERNRAEERVEALAAAAAAAAAAHRAAQTRLDDARSRVSRAQRALDQAKSDRAAVGGVDDPAMQPALAERDEAQAQLEAARGAVEAIEALRAAAEAAEHGLRAQARDLEDRLGALRSQVKGLTQLTASVARDGFAPALDSTRPEPGLEAALAAALGDDLEAPVDPRAKAYWGGAEPRPPVWPQGAVPLAPLVEAPSQLAARLARTALVEAKDGERLRGLIEPGCRLVSRAGDLWRWDGFVALAAAPRPAAVRLEQRNQLIRAQAQLAALEPEATQATVNWRSAGEALRDLQQAAQEARRAPLAAEARLQATRARLEGFERERARREARA
ncbi:MAG: smc, partial [Caulobacteraceae bacterium]|nr:smc [Caulobacteraceae bacterium]